ncbi:hypothetical protein TNCV_610831 [Trichonephila clavipes]|nr:hypothetical protein TNCV_610831 [Trichonephila clavipes]
MDSETTQPIRTTKLSGAALRKYDQQKISLATASSSIAATLLSGGQTANLALKLPLHIHKYILLTTFYNVIKAKGFKAIDKYSKNDFVFAYTDVSSDETFSNGGSRVFMTTPSDATYQRVIGATSCELQAISEVLDLYETVPILEQGKGLVILCDSQTALQAALNGGSWITEEFFLACLDYRS